MRSAAAVARWDTQTLNQIKDIRRLWGDTLHKNLAVAQIVSELQIPKGDYNHAGLPFQYSWFRKLKKIAAHKEINDWQYREILPDARRTLYAISKLNSRLFSLALQEGMIHPRVTAEEIEQWYRRKLGVREPHPLKLTIRPKKTLDQRGSEEEPDENERDKLVSKLRREMDAIGFSVSDRPIAEKRHGD